MATIIIVDRIGANSRIERLAREVDGTIVQTSAGYWPQVVRVLNRVLGFEHELLKMEHAQIEKYLRRKLSQVPLDAFIDSKEVISRRLSEARQDYLG